MPAGDHDLPPLGFWFLSDKLTFEKSGKLNEICGVAAPHAYSLDHQTL